MQVSMVDMHVLCQTDKLVDNIFYFETIEHAVNLLIAWSKSWM